MIALTQLSFILGGLARKCTDHHKLERSRQVGCQTKLLKRDQSLDLSTLYYLDKGLMHSRFLVCKLMMLQKTRRAKLKSIRAFTGKLGSADRAFSQESKVRKMP